MPTKRQPSQKRRKAEWHRVVENFSRLSKREGVPRDPAEAYAWLKQLASEMLAAQEKTNEAIRAVAEAALQRAWTTISSAPKHQAAGSSVQGSCRAMGRTIRAMIVSPYLVKWFTNAVKAYTLGVEEPAEGEKRTLSMDAALDLKRSRGHSRNTEDKRAIEIYCLREEGKSWKQIADRLPIEPRTAQRIYEARADEILRYLISHGAIDQSGPIPCPLRRACRRCFEHSDVRVRSITVEGGECPNGKRPAWREQAGRRGWGIGRVGEPFAHSVERAPGAVLAAGPGCARRHRRNRPARGQCIERTGKSAR